MKFYKKSLLNLFTVISCLFFCLTSKNVNISKADSNEIIEIGDFYTTINVTTTVKVYVSGEEINWAIDCGFEIYTEFFNPNFLLNQLEHVITPPVTLYYYYATPTHPRITGKRTLYNDVDSLVFLVNYMESIASSSNISDPKNAVLGYIRGINTNYCLQSNYANFDKWNIICGSYTSSLLSSIDNRYAGGGIKVKDYFASFVSSINYNSQQYGDCGSSYLAMNLDLVDPVSETASIDLIHMFASLDGIFEGTGETTSNYTYFNYMTKDTYRYLVSWAGDLQTSAKAIENAGLTNFDFVDILNGQYQFDLSDFKADVDATNIATRVNLNNSPSISSMIEDYYDDLLTGQDTREDLFISKIASTANPEYTFFNDESAFVYIIYDMLKIDGNGNNQGFNLPSYIKYSLLLEDNHITFVDFSYRHNLAIAFFEYFDIPLELL